MSKNFRALPAQLMSRAHDFMLAGALRPNQYGLLNHMLFMERRAGDDCARVSLTTLVRKLHCGRDWLVKTLRLFEQLGLMTKIRTDLWVNYLGAKVRRQGTNIYVFSRTPPESRCRTVSREVKNQEKKAHEQGCDRSAGPHGQARETGSTGDSTSRTVSQGVGVGPSKGGSGLADVASAVNFGFKSGDRRLREGAAGSGHADHPAKPNPLEAALAGLAAKAELHYFRPDIRPG
ncbi:hypothetical protein JMJ56_27500 [Belnapia sp. T18]|uniref:Bacteriophage lambda Replication protein O N-terminal domain-containing protein n=1 Tax=Belnapia arida TaxID=2804533 RepID=A0ABS1UAL9_9PROT|nr:hypothetical protein [Belnapia arida]MBL6081732.1 hypothetical protein [Belnapia arida]